jgi:hypothetical protein
MVDHFVIRSGVTNFSAFRDALPMLSKYLTPSVSSTASSVNSKPDPATLLAENHALRDAMEQQRFKLKVNLVVFFPAFLLQKDVLLSVVLVASCE